MAIVFDSESTPKLINITSPQDTIQIQDLINAIRTWESSEDGVVFDPIVTPTDSAGKSDIGGGILTAITISISTEWRLKFWAGVGVGFVLGGNLAGGYLADPIEPTGSGDTIKQVSAESGVIAETGVSGLTPTESAALLQNTADLSTMTSSVTVIEGDIGLIQTDIASLQSDVATLNVDVGLIQVDISQIKADIITINTDIGSIQLDISNIELDMAFIKAIESGEWKIDNNQMIFYDSGSSEIARFNLFNNAGQPTNEDVYRRVPV